MPASKLVPQQAKTASITVVKAKKPVVSKTVPKSTSSRDLLQPSTPQSNPQTERDFRKILRSASKAGIDENSAPSTAVPVNQDDLEKYLAEKTKAIAELKLLRDRELAKKAELARQTTLFRQQTEITQDIIKKEKVAWQCDSASLLCRHQMTEIMTKQEAVAKLLDSVQTKIDEFVQMLVKSPVHPQVTEMIAVLDKHTQLEMFGRTDLPLLVKDAFDAKTNFDASDDDTYISVGNGKYSPLLVWSLISVGILRYHETDPKRVVLNCNLGKY